MRTITTTIKVFRFHELPEHAKTAAIWDHGDINVSYDWWDYIYDDAAKIGLKIKSFDIGHNRDIAGRLTVDIAESIDAVLTDHGPSCATYQMARKYRAKLAPIQSVIRDCADPETDDEYAALDNAETALEDLESEYEYDLREEYLAILTQEYDYRTSDEAIIETLELNEYEFTVDGEII